MSGAAFTDFLLDLIAGDFPGVLGCFHFDHRDLTRSLGLGRLWSATLDGQPLYGRASWVPRHSLHIKLKSEFIIMQPIPVALMPELCPRGDASVSSGSNRLR